jgi:hypothetical protein
MPLQDTALVAGLLVTTEAKVAECPEKKARAISPPGGMGRTGYRGLWTNEGIQSSEVTRRSYRVIIVPVVANRELPIRCEMLPGDGTHTHTPTRVASGVLRMGDARADSGDVAPPAGPSSG